MTYIFGQFYYIFIFEARYLMKWLLLHVLFSHFLCIILIFLFLKYYITFTISFRSEENRSNVKTNFIFCPSTSCHRLKPG